MLAFVSEWGWKVFDRWLLNKFASSLSVMAKVLLGFVKWGTKSFLLVLFFIDFHKEPLTGVSDDKNE
jgi:hypothetical protein